MSRLTVYNENDTDTPILDTRDAEQISRELDKVGVLFERWPAEQSLPADATPEQIGDAYAADIERLQAQFGYQTWDVIGIHPEHPQKDVMRAKFLDEHRHSEDRCASSSTARACSPCISATRSMRRCARPRI